MIYVKIRVRTFDLRRRKKKKMEGRTEEEVGAKEKMEEDKGK